MAEHNGQVVPTQEMEKLLYDIDPLIDTYVLANKFPHIRLDKKQWHCIQKDRKRIDWRKHRNYGIIHFADGSVQYRDFILIPISAPKEWSPGVQLDIEEVRGNKR